MSQTELADKTGVTQGYISHVEKGIREGKLDVLFALCRALGVTCSHFEQFFPDPSPPAEKPKRGRPRKT